MRHSPKMRHFQAQHVQVFFKAKRNGSHSPNFKIKTHSVTEKCNLWSICHAWKCKRRLKMSCISLLKLGGFTLKKIDLSVFSSLQRYFLHLPDFLLSSKASAPAKRAQRSARTYRSIKEKSKAKLITRTYIDFSKQYFGWPYLPFSINLTTCS